MKCIKCQGPLAANSLRGAAGRPGGQAPLLQGSGTAVGIPGTAEQAAQPTALPHFPCTPSASSSAFTHLPDLILHTMTSQHHKHPSSSPGRHAWGTSTTQDNVSEPLKYFCPLISKCTKAVLGRFLVKYSSPSQELLPVAQPLPASLFNVWYQCLLKSDHQIISLCRDKTLH